MQVERMIESVARMVLKSIRKMLKMWTVRWNELRLSLARYWEST